MVGCQSSSSTTISTLATCLVSTCRNVGVFCAETGATGLMLAEQIEPAVVLVELGLPGAIDGWEVARLLKAHPLTQKAVVIAVTSHAFLDELALARHSGCDDVLTKPVDLSVLVEADLAGGWGRTLPAGELVNGQIRTGSPPKQHQRSKRLRS